jgi:hypothetical protein
LAIPSSEHLKEWRRKTGWAGGETRPIVDIKKISYHVRDLAMTTPYIAQSIELMPSQENIQDHSTLPAKQNF